MHHAGLLLFAIVVFAFVMFVLRDSEEVVYEEEAPHKRKFSAKLSRSEARRLARQMLRESRIGNGAVELDLKPERDE